MATQTENLGLTKPDAAEGYDINVFNNNADIVDGAVGALLKELGGAGGGLGDKVDTLLQNVAAVKTDTAALVQALATANANIATLLSNHGSVKTIVRGSVLSSGAVVDITIPDTMDASKVVALFDARPSHSTNTTGTTWTLSGRTYQVTSSAGSITYQLIEFY